MGRSPCFWATEMGVSKLRAASMSWGALHPLQWGTSMATGHWTWPWLAAPYQYFWATGMGVFRLRVTSAPGASRVRCGRGFQRRWGAGPGGGQHWYAQPGVAGQYLGFFGERGWELSDSKELQRRAKPFFRCIGGLQRGWHFGPGGSQLRFG